MSWVLQTHTSTLSTLWLRHSTQVWTGDDGDGDDEFYLQVDEDSKGYLTEEETAVGLGAINPNLRDSDMVYLFRVSLSQFHSDMVYLFRASLSSFTRIWSICFG